MSKKTAGVHVFSLCSIRTECDARQAMLQYGAVVSQLSSNLEQMLIPLKK